VAGLSGTTVSAVPDVQRAQEPFDFSGGRLAIPGS
jgi:hypothetical protein